MRVGIIICDRYKSCDGGKCFRSARNLEGAFKKYNEPVEIVGYSSCGGCPGGNIENVVSGMKKYGAQTIHLATGFLAGYPPCPYIDVFVKFIKEKTDLDVVVGTHPMPTNYISMHEKIGDWNNKHKNLMKTFNLLEDAGKYDSSSSDYETKLNRELENLG